MLFLQKAHNTEHPSRGFQIGAGLYAVGRPVQQKRTAKSAPITPCPSREGPYSTVFFPGRAPSGGLSPVRAHARDGVDTTTTSFTRLSPPGTHFTAESTEAMRIKCLAQGNNILLPGFKPSTSVSETNILANRPICFIYP